MKILKYEITGSDIFLISFSSKPPSRALSIIYKWEKVNLFCSAPFRKMETPHFGRKDTGATI